jgi:uncharacterized SAM-binding protein YcdF (DUF218 family)
MNDFLLWLGLDNWRPVLAALVLPPVPFILLVLIGARLMFRRRLLAWFLVIVSVLGLWFSATPIGAYGLAQWLLPPTRALSPGEVGDLKKAPRTAIVVLGGGIRKLAPEYGVSDLKPLALDRLRYGLWLARETSLPVLFSGGIGHGGQVGDPTEAEVAARVAERDFGRPLRWTEGESRDTRENAIKSVALLRAQGIERIVVVTHAYHMARSMRNFERAVAGGGGRIELMPAPMGVWTRPTPVALDFVPTREGFTDARLVLHEWLGRLIGA